MGKALMVVVEGIDGAGKRTQTEGLLERAKQAGHRGALLSFPRYGQTLFSRTISDYLNGKLGTMQSLPAQLVALLYAGDRLESLSEINRLRAENDLLVFDRYVSSNLAYQAAKVPEAQRAELMDWVYRVEHDVYGLPKPDLNIFLDLSPETSARLMAKRGARAYTSKSADLHEADRVYMDTCRRVYHDLAASSRYGDWRTIRCDSEDGQMLPPAAIGQAIWDAVAARLA